MTEKRKKRYGIDGAGIRGWVWIRWWPRRVVAGADVVADADVVAVLLPVLMPLLMRL